MRIKRTIICVVLTCVWTAASVAVAAEQKSAAAARAKAIAPFIGEETVAVLYLDVSRLKAGPLVDKLVELVPEAAEQQTAMKLGAAAALGAFAQVGGKDVYMVIDLADIGPFMKSPPPVIVPLYDGANEEALRLLMAPYEVKGQRMAGALVGCGEDTWERLRSMTPLERPELVEAFEAAGDAAAQAVLLPTADNRRAIEEMIPTLPDEIGGGPSTIVTRGILWAAAGIDPPPGLALRLTVESEDAPAAEALREMWIAAYRFAGQQKEVRQAIPNFDPLAALLTPEVQGDRLSLVLDERNKGIASLISMVRPPVEKARAAAQRAASMNNLKWIALAMQNHYSALKHFPAAASRDPAGKPLLSWRVHILPYIEHNELYKQFHLDEPWDSPHNRTLIDRMPDVYRSPGSKLQEKGRTSYLVSVGEETVFSGHKAATIKEITDGTSQTIMAVEVDDDHTVIWTKPEDLPYDPKQPAQGLGGLFEGGFCAAFCDGSVHFLPDSIDPKVLRNLFSRADGQVIPPGSW